MVAIDQVRGQSPQQWAQALDTALGKLQGTKGDARQQALQDIFELRGSLDTEIMGERKREVALDMESHGNGRAYFSWPGGDVQIGKGKQAEEAREFAVELAKEAVLRHIADYAQAGEAFSARARRPFVPAEAVGVWQGQRATAEGADHLGAIGGLQAIGTEIETFWRLAEPSYDPKLEHHLRDFQKLEHVRDGGRAVNALRNYHDEIFHEFRDLHRAIAERAVSLADEIAARPGGLASVTAAERAVLITVEPSLDALPGGIDGARRDDPRVDQAVRLMYSLMK